jgi:hypothetical protein
MGESNASKQGTRAEQLIAALLGRPQLVARPDQAEADPQPGAEPEPTS